MSKGVIVFIEGDTDEEIYKKFISKLHEIIGDGKFSVDKLIIRPLKGITNYKNRALRVFANDILPKNPGIDFIIFLCHDTDVFDFSPKPPVNWKEVEKLLIKAGVKKVYRIGAERCIEDWMLKDIEGLCSYLKLPKTTKLNGDNGLKKIENLFKKANKMYVKGSKVKGLVDNLDIQKVICPQCSQVRMLCRELGVKCRNR